MGLIVGWMFVGIIAGVVKLCNEDGLSSGQVKARQGNMVMGGIAAVALICLLGALG